MQGCALTINEEIIHPSDVRLGLAANRPNTVWFIAMTRLCIIAVSIDVVVECQFLTGHNRPLHEDAHPHMLPHMPFRNVAIGIAAVIDESCLAAHFRGVDILTPGCTRQLIAITWVVLLLPTSSRARAMK